MANIPRLMAVLKHDETRSAWIQPLAVVLNIGHILTKTEQPYCYYKLVRDIIRTVKIHVLSNSSQGSSPPFYNSVYKIRGWLSMNIRFPLVYIH